MESINLVGLLLKSRGHLEEAEEKHRLALAGYTAALAIHRMEQNGQLPENGPVVVTGATLSAYSFSLVGTGHVKVMASAFFAQDAGPLPPPT